MAKFMIVLAALLLIPTAVTADEDPIITESTSESTVTSKSESTVRSAPPSAISPSINSSNSDICAIGASGAVQTQILGISGGTAFRDMNCERLKLSKTLFDMGMKVAAVSVMCGDPRVFTAMENAGTPCPYDGKIGPEAQKLWDENPDQKPTVIEEKRKQDESNKKILGGVGALGVLLLLL